MNSIFKNITAILDHHHKGDVDYVINGVQRHGDGVVVTYTVEWARKSFTPRVAFFKDRGETLVNSIVCQ